MEYYLAVATFTFVAGLTPGPNNIMLLASGVNHGVAKSLPHYLGVCIGFPAMVAAIGFGLGTVFNEYPAVHKAIKVLGVSYLLFLAWKIGNAGNPEAKGELPSPLTFWHAAAFQWVNPKGWIVAVSSVAAFTTPGRVTEDLVFLLSAFSIAGFITMGFWLTAGAGLKKILGDGRRRRVFNVAMAALLALSVIPMVLVDFNDAGM